MTYGWALMVVMVVGLAMWQLGIFNMGSNAVTTQGFAKIAPQIAGTGLSAAGVFTGTFTNAAGTKIELTGVRVYSGNTDTILCCSHKAAGDGCNNAGSDVGGLTYSDFGGDEIAPVSTGQNFAVVLGGTGAESGAKCQIDSAEVAKPYIIRVEVDYNILIGTQTMSHTSSGTIRGPFE